jgi:hypothetical protein
MIAQSSALNDCCKPREMEGLSAGALFESMLPKIRKMAAFAFRRCKPQRRDELIAAVVAKAYVALTQLVERGKAALAYPSVLANYAIRQVLSGRDVGARQNARDVLSPHCRDSSSRGLQPLGGSNWTDLIPDRRATPPQIVALRLDFRSWLAQLEDFKRRIALRLAYGDTTGEAAQYFGVSAGRISQLRQELFRDWRAFHQRAEQEPDLETGALSGRNGM